MTCPDNVKRITGDAPMSQQSATDRIAASGASVSSAGFLPGIEAPNGILSYGGGRQTVAICALILQGRLPRPDIIVMADTGRENPMTWDYLRDVTGPAMDAAGMPIKVVAPGRCQPDIYAGNGDLQLPVYTATGKLRPFCSGHWKRDSIDQWLRHVYGIRGGVKWIGFSADEKRRLGAETKEGWAELARGNWSFWYPLVALKITSDGCREIIAAHGWPQPHRSSCWMCPNKKDHEWAYIRDHYPGLWAQACEIDEDCRENDERGGVWLHRARVPLAEALDRDAAPESDPRCETGMCFV